MNIRSMITTAVLALSATFGVAGVASASTATVSAQDVSGAFVTSQKVTAGEQLSFMGTERTVTDVKRYGKGAYQFRLTTLFPEKYAGKRVTFTVG